MCGGFTCSKNALIALNILYILVSLILVGVAAYGQAASIVSNITLVGVIIACGVFLFLLSLLGLLGAIKHHQVLLFFYMVILFMLFLIQFGVACACLAINEEEQHELASEGWKHSNAQLRRQAQITFNCCGFEQNDTSNITPSSKDSCVGVVQCCPTENDCFCTPCWEKLKEAIGRALEICGGIGLFFSLTEFVGVWLTVRYRNQKDPRANPSAFL